MADPAPVAQTFFVDDFVQEYYKLDGIVTLIDAKHIEQHLDEEKPEGAENESVEQVAFADRLILNKIDLMPKEEDLKRVEDRLRSMNAFAPIIRTTQSSVSAENVLNLKAFNLNRTLEMDPEFLNTDAEHEHDESVSSLGINVKGEVDMSALSVWMDDLLREQGGDIFRMKGVLACQGYPKKWAYQAVHMIMSSVFRYASHPCGTSCTHTHCSWLTAHRSPLAARRSLHQRGLGRGRGALLLAHVYW